MVATRRRSRQEEVLTDSGTKSRPLAFQRDKQATPTPTPSGGTDTVVTPTEAKLTKLDPQGLEKIQSARVRNGLPALTDEQLLTELDRREAEGVDVSEARAIVQARITETKTNIAEGLTDQGVLKEGTPEGSIDLVEGSRERVVPETGIGLIDNYVGFLSSFPGVKPFLKTVKKDTGIGEEELKNLRAQNPDRADQIEVEIGKLVREEQSKDFGQRFLENLGSSIDNFPFTSKLSQFTDLPTPTKKINSIKTELGKSDTFLDSVIQLSKTRPEEATNHINDMQQNLLELEAKLQLLTLQSEKIQADTQELDNLEQLITISYQKLNRARDNIALTIIQEQLGVQDPDVEKRNLINDIKRLA